MGDINKIDTVTFICENCDTVFKYSSGLSRHKKSRCSKTLKENYEKKMVEIKQETSVVISNIENKCKIEKLEEKVTMLQDQLKKSEEKHRFYEKLIKESNVMAKTTVSALAYAMMNLTTAPKIEPIENIEQFILDGRKKDRFEHFILYLNRNNMLQSHIGEMLVKAYKTPNPRDQAFWNTDTARLSYILREAAGDATEWRTDKGGVKIKTLVIEPLLESIKDKMLEYMEELNEELQDKNTDNNTRLKILKDMDEIHQIVDLINAKTVAKDIIRIIAPEFHLDKSMAVKDNTNMELILESEDEEEPKIKAKPKSLTHISSTKKRGRPKKIDNKSI